MALPPVTSRIGTLSIAVDGEWDMEDLRELSESLSESYGLFYPLVAPDDQIRNKLQDALRKQFWSGDIETRHFGRFLYRNIPKDDSLRIRSFHYSSPGMMEVMGILACLYMLSRVARAWIKTSDDFLIFYQKVEKFFERRKQLRRPKRETALDEELSLNSDEARVLAFELGEKLGFDALSCEKLIQVVGNPISALKYLVAAANEARKVAELEMKGMLQLPAPTGDGLTIQAPTTTKRGRSGVVVERKKSRGPKKP